MHQTLAGVFPVLPTVFHDDGRIDEEGCRRVAEWVIDSGVDGVVFPGLASEYDCLSLDERIALIALIGEVARGRVHFVVGASGQSIEESRALVEAGHAACASAAMVMTPGRMGRDITSLTAFYTSLGEIGVPLMLQNAPAPMGSGLSPAEVALIVANVPAIRWVKEENMPCGQRITALLAAAPGHLDGVFGGAGGRYITDELARGSLGTMPAAELPQAHVRLYAAHQRGDAVEVRNIFESMLPLLMLQAVFRWDLTKEVLRRRGLILSAHVRANGPRLDASDHQELEEILARVDAKLLPVPA